MMVVTVQTVICAHIECNAVVNKTTSNIQEYRHLIRTPAKQIWKRAPANDLGRLAQGVGTCMKQGTNTIHFIAQ